MNNHTLTQFDFSQEGGFPLTQNRLNEMQETYLNAMYALTSVVGDNLIVSGCQEVGGQVQSGWVILNGELLPLLGPTNKNTYLVKEETPTTLCFNDDQDKPVIFKKQAVFTDSSVNAVKWDEMKQINTLKSHLADQNNPHQVTKQQVGLGNLPNIKSDDIESNNSNSLATNAAVYNLKNKIYSDISKIEKINTHCGYLKIQPNSNISNTLSIKYGEIARFKDDPGSNYLDIHVIASSNGNIPALIHVKVRTETQDLDAYIREKITYYLDITAHLTGTTVYNREEIVDFSCFVTSKNHQDLSVVVGNGEGCFYI